MRAPHPLVQARALLEAESVHSLRRRESGMPLSPSCIQWTRIFLLHTLEGVGSSHRLCLPCYGKGGADVKSIEAVIVAAEDVVAANRDLREHPSSEAEQCLQSCITLLDLRLVVFRRGVPRDTIPHEPSRHGLGADA